MGLISRVSSRTYRSKTKMFCVRRLTTTAARRVDPIQQIYVSKIKEYAKLASAGRLDQAEVDASIAAAKARLGGSKDMESFPKMEFTDADHSNAVEFKLH